MELQLKHGDYVSDGAGGVRRVAGNEVLLQRALFRLTARRGAFPFWESLGSQLWKLGQVPVAKRQSAAVQCVTEALSEETGLRVASVALTDRGSGAVTVTAELVWEGRTLSVDVEVPV